MTKKILISTAVAFALGAAVTGALTGGVDWRGRPLLPMSQASAAAMAPAATAPVAPPMALLPANGFTQLVARYGPAVVNVSVVGSVKVSGNPQEMPGMPNLGPNNPFGDFFNPEECLLDCCCGGKQWHMQSSAVYNIRLEGSAQQRFRCWAPSSLHSSAPPQPSR